MSVKFPDKKFAIKNIPVDTANIFVVITGFGLSEPFNFSLTREFPTKRIYGLISGDKLVKAEARDKNSKLLAKGSGHVNVINNIDNKIEIELKTDAEINNQNPTQSPTPSPKVSFAPIIPDGNPVPSPIEDNSGNVPITNPVIPVPEITQSSKPNPTSTQVLFPNHGGGGVNNSTQPININLTVATSSPTPSAITFSVGP